MALGFNQDENSVMKGRFIKRVLENLLRAKLHNILINVIIIHFQCFSKYWQNPAGLEKFRSNNSECIIRVQWIFVKSGNFSMNYSFKAFHIIIISAVESIGNATTFLIDLNCFKIIFKLINRWYSSAKIIILIKKTSPT